MRLIQRKQPLDGYLTSHDGILGAVNGAYATPTDSFFDFIALGHDREKTQLT